MSKERKEQKHPSKEKEQYGKEMKEQREQSSKNKPFGHGSGCGCSSCK